MKRLTILGVFILLAAASVSAQDYDKIKQAILMASLPNAGEQQYMQAKAELDKLAANPKAQGKPELYMYQLEFYGTMASNDKAKGNFPNAAELAWQALQKYLQLDPSEGKLKDDSYMGISGIYTSFFNSGVENYNKKNWDLAFAKLKLAVEVSDLFIAKKWFTSNFDTAAYLYAGASAQSGKRDDEAIKYYSAIVDRKIAGPDYEAVYDFVAKYYYNKKDQAQLQKYIALAKAAYPANPVWNDLEFASTTETISPEDMMKKFTDAEAANNITASSYLDYADFFANNKKVKELDSAKRAVYNEKAAYAFWRSYEKDPSNPLVAYNAGVTYYSMFVDALDRVQSIKGITPEIKTKRDQAYKVSDEAADRAFAPLEAAFGSLAAKSNRTTQEKNVLGKVTDLLFNLYDYKRNRSRVLNPKDYDKYEAKAKYYDNLHGTSDKLLISPNSTTSGSSSTETSITKRGQINLTKVGGVYKIKTTVNGLLLDMIFDTGASDVAISLTEAMFMLKNGYLKKEDITGSSKYQTADGSITEGTIINIREMTIGGIILKNVKASVTNSISAPILLGQSVLERFGTIRIDNKNYILTIE